MPGIGPQLVSTRVASGSAAAPIARRARSSEELLAGAGDSRSARAGTGDGRSTSTPAVVVEREPAGLDTDSATAQTIRKMCEYVRLAIADPLVRRCAAFAWRRFGQGLPSSDMKVWAVFWWVKHCIRFRQDEATMFRVGLEQEQDLLIDPRLLLRMREPAEDCDGFTMLGAAMASILGVPVYIVTVAASPDDRRRWSHVFLVALTRAGVVPLDMSHGVGPGWMIPRGHIFRWQAWGLDGRPVDIAPARFQGLHGYVRTSSRGLGQDDYFLTDADYTAALPAASGGGGGNWAPWLQGLIQQGVDVVGKIYTPPAYQQTVRDPVTGQMLSTTVRNYASPSTALTAGAGSLAGVPPIVWWAGGGLIALVVLSKAMQSR